MKEVQAENGHRVRINTDDDAEAFEKATEVDPDIEMAGVVDVTGKPVGWDGGDPHDAQAQGESYDAGDYR